MKTFSAIKDANKTVNSNELKEISVLFETAETDVERFKKRFGEDTQKILCEAFPEVVMAIRNALQTKQPNPQAANVFLGVLGAFDKNFEAGVDPLSAYRFAWTSQGAQLEKLGQAYLQANASNPQLKAIAGVLSNPAEHDPYVIRQVVGFLQQYANQVGRQFKGAAAQQQPQTAAQQAGQQPAQPAAAKPSLMQQVAKPAPAA